MGSFYNFFYNFLENFYNFLENFYNFLENFCDFLENFSKNFCNFFRLLRFPYDFSENFSENSRSQSVTVQPGFRHYCKFTSKFTPKFTPILIKILQSTKFEGSHFFNSLTIFTISYGFLATFTTFHDYRKLCPSPPRFPNRSSAFPKVPMAVPPLATSEVCGQYEGL